MGMILTGGYLTYLVDDSGIIAANPQQLFEIVDHKLPSNWLFRPFANTHPNFINVEAIWGYEELVRDEAHYEQLIEFDESAHQIYFKRKKELTDSPQSKTGR